MERIQVAFVYKGEVCDEEFYVHATGRLLAPDDV